MYFHEDYMSFNVNLLNDCLNLNVSIFVFLIVRCRYHENPLPSGNSKIQCSKFRSGNTLKIQLRYQNALTLCEVKVFGSMF